MVEFIKKHSNLFTILGLLIFCYVIFFLGIGTYHLMDIDETRYVLMSRDMFHSKDFMTLYLNGEYFFEKPPLYFWGEVISFTLFGKVTELTARFPVAIYGTLSTMLLYFVGQKVISRRYGIISALILATSLEFLILAKYAILDILLATCIEFAICLGFLTFFVKESNKKYCWWGFYLFTGLAVLAKGVPGVALPVMTMFFVSIFSKKFKEIFRPQYFLVGLIIFALIVLPWHIVMLKTHNPLFYNEYVVKHHLARFLDSSQVGRRQPWFFFMLTFLWGFCPWIFSGIAVFITKIKYWFKKESIRPLFATDKFNNLQKYLFFNFVAFVVIMLFFSSSSTKLITYILPIYFTASNLVAWVWVRYISEGRYQKEIAIASYIFFGILLFASIVALFTPIFLPEKIYSYILPVKSFTITVMFFFGLLGLIFIKKQNRVAIFASYVGFFTVLSAFGIPKYFEMDYTFGQNDLMKYGKYALENNLKLKAINTGKHYSLNYYGPKEAYFLLVAPEDIQKTINNGDKDTLFIIRNKHIKQTENLKFTTVDVGEKYTLLKK